MAKRENWGLDAKWVDGAVHATVDMTEPGTLSAFHRALGRRFSIGDRITVLTKPSGPQVRPRRRLVLKVIEAEIMDGT